MMPFFPNSFPGSTYVTWGRSRCPSRATTVYSGRTRLLLFIQSQLDFVIIIIIDPFYCLFRLNTIFTVFKVWFEFYRLSRKCSMLTVYASRIHVLQCFSLLLHAYCPRKKKSTASILYSRYDSVFNVYLGIAGFKDGVESLEKADMILTKSVRRL